MSDAQHGELVSIIGWRTTNHLVTAMIPADPQFEVK